MLLLKILLKKNKMQFQFNVQRELQEKLKQFEVDKQVSSLSHISHSRSVLSRASLIRKTARQGNCSGSNYLILQNSFLGYAVSAPKYCHHCTTPLLFSHPATYITASEKESHARVMQSAKGPLAQLSSTLRIKHLLPSWHRNISELQCKADRAQFNSKATQNQTIQRDTIWK